MPRLRLLLALLVLALACGPAVAAEDLRGTWRVDILLGGSVNNTQYWRLTAGDPAAGTYSGDTGTQPAGATFGTLTATLSGTSFQMTNPYSTTSYTATFTGTLTSPGAMSGTWTSSASQSGTWTATRAAPAPTPTPAPPEPAVPPDPASPSTPRTGARPSATAVLCNRGPNDTSPSQCTATVGDAGPAPPVTPSGTVTWTAAKGSVGPSCILQPTPSSPGVASCSVTYLPGPEGTPAGTAIPVRARYQGDANLAPSEAEHRLITAFCIGTSTRPCPGGVADAFLRPSLTLTAERVLQSLRVILGCGDAVQTASQIGFETPGSCTGRATILSQLGLDSPSIARALESPVNQERLLEGLRGAYTALAKTDRRAVTGGGPACRGLGFAGTCAPMLEALGVTDAVASDIAKNLTVDELAAMTETLSQAYAEAAGTPGRSRLLSWTRRTLALRRACEEFTPEGKWYRRLRCDEIRGENARRPVLLVGRVSARVRVGGAVEARVRLTAGGSLLSGFLGRIGAQSLPLTVRATVRAPGTRPRTVTRTVTVPIRGTGPTR